MDKDRKVNQKQWLASLALNSAFMCFIGECGIYNVDPFDLDDND